VLFFVHLEGQDERTREDPSGVCRAGETRRAAGHQLLFSPSNRHHPSPAFLIGAGKVGGAAKEPVAEHEADWYLQITFLTPSQERQTLKRELSAG